MQHINTSQLDYYRTPIRTYVLSSLEDLARVVARLEVLQHFHVHGVAGETFVFRHGVVHQP